MIDGSIDVMAYTDQISALEEELGATQRLLAEARWERDVAQETLRQHVEAKEMVEAEADSLRDQAGYLHEDLHRVMRERGVARAWAKRWKRKARAERCDRRIFEHFFDEHHDVVFELAKEVGVDPLIVRVHNVPGIAGRMPSTSEVLRWSLEKIRGLRTAARLWKERSKENLELAQVRANDTARCAIDRNHYMADVYRLREAAQQARKVFRKVMKASTDGETYELSTIHDWMLTVDAWFDAMVFHAGRERREGGK